MRGEWLHRHGASTLVVFFNGWSMDSTPMTPLTARDCDVLAISDYRHLGLDCDLSGSAAGYDQTILLAWSMGVWAAQKFLAGQSHVFDRALAINGTLCPIDDRFGIPPALFAATREQFDEKARLKFYRRMCRKKEILERFLAHRPARSLAGQLAELIALEAQVECWSATDALYDHILISDQDMIMPTENQRAFWQVDQELPSAQKGRPDRKIVEIAAPHFPFYRWQGWDELLAEVWGTGYA